MQEFATFVSFDAIGEDAMPLSLGSAWQYFGAVKNALKIKHPHHELYREQSWYVGNSQNGLSLTLNLIFFNIKYSKTFNDTVSQT